MLKISKLGQKVNINIENKQINELLKTQISDEKK